jgi:hypothetical protein
MTLTRHLMVWTLRALVLWGGFEAGASIWEYASAHSASLSRLAGHEQAMQRLAQRYEQRNRLAAMGEALVTRLSAHSMEIAPSTGESEPRAAARIVRDALLAAGAQAPVVDVSQTQAGAGVTRVRLTARWRESAETSPQALYALAQSYPTLEVEQLTLTRTENAVRAELGAAVLVRTNAREAPVQ